MLFGINGCVTPVRATLRSGCARPSTAREIMFAKASVIFCFFAIVGAQLTPGFRPPSVPLMVVNPYFSVWSSADHLYDNPTVHWSGSIAFFAGMTRIDGKPYRFMSSDADLPENVMPQKGVQVFPTRTVYSFETSGVQLNLTFATPSLPDQVEYGSLPITFIRYDVKSIDGSMHNVSLYYDNTAEIAVSDVSENVTWSRTAAQVGGYATMRIGTLSQQFAKEGSDRINWGYLYVSVLQENSLQTTMANVGDSRGAFMKNQPFPSDSTDNPRPCNDKWPGIAVSWNLGSVGPTGVSRYALVAYDQIDSMLYFGTEMTPYWRYVYKGSVSAMLSYAHANRDAIVSKCVNTDNSVMSVLGKLGGSNYTSIASLVWRQAVGGTESVWNGVINREWRFMKEISSDGDVSTVDVLFPASPLFVWKSPQSFYLMLEPLLAYTNNETATYGLNVTYNLPWCPHHLGHWPICDLPPNHQEQMPIEETGNILIMLAAIAKADPSWLLSNVAKYKHVLRIFGDYLVSSLPDPENQLCTDDFEGPSPHNVNLAAKGIVGLGAYAYILELDGNKTGAAYYSTIAQKYAQYWLQHSLDKDHYRLQYNLADSWSLKYNLMYQRLFGFKLFPDSVFTMEESYYKQKMNQYGVPLDDRADFTKADWMMWVAAMGSQDQFQTLVDKLYLFANTTPDRVPFTDWYYTSTAKRRGFTARPVMGGLYARALLMSTLSVDPRI